MAMGEVLMDTKQRSTHILIAEDDLTSRTILAAVLQRRSEYQQAGALSRTQCLEMHALASDRKSVV